MILLQDSPYRGVLFIRKAERTLKTPNDPCLAAAEFLDNEYKEENVEIIAWMTVKVVDRI